MQKLTISFVPQGGEVRLPLARCAILQGLMYKLVSYDAEYSDMLHNGGSGHEVKFFCFSDLAGDTVIRDGQFCGRGLLTWEIRSADDRLINAAATGLRRVPEFELHGLPCAVRRLAVSSDYIIGDRCRLTMLMPLTVFDTDPETNYRTFYDPQDARFAEQVRENLRAKWEILTGKPLMEEISFAPADGGKGKKCVTRYKNAPYTGYYGTYTLTAPEPLLNIAYYAGLGAANAKGFGTWELI